MIRQYIVDAFTDQVFKGNPAAICILDDWLEESLMQNIANENNLSETAFAVKEGDKYHIRWFTPGGEIGLCGHATLAASYVLFHFYEKASDRVTYTSLSGELYVERKGSLLEMEFPAYDLEAIAVTDEMEKAVGAKVNEAYMGRDLLLILENSETVRNLQPDIEAVKQLPGLLCHVSAPGEDTDCISRSFCPKHLIVDDPVCGSGHCHIVPYWAKTLGKNEIVAYQASRRGGTLYTRLTGNSVYLAGQAVLFAESKLYL